MRTRFTQFQAMAERAKKEGGNRGGTWRLKIEEGQEVVVYFTNKGGDGNDPYDFLSHWNNGRNTSEVCSGDDSCVICHSIAAGDKQFGAHQARSVFNVVDTSEYHVFGEGQNKSYEDCTRADTGRCQSCSNGNEPRLRGRRRAEFAPRWTQLLVDQQNELQRRCGSCFRGVVEVVGYYCVHCNEEYDLDAEQAFQAHKCGGCKKKSVFEEILECNRCDQPVRGTLFEGKVPVRIKRAAGVGGGGGGGRGKGVKEGKGGGAKNKKQGTVYSFIPEWPPEDDRPDWLDEEDYLPVDLEAEYQPRDADVLSKDYNLRNPNNHKEAAQFESYQHDDPYAAPGGGRRRGGRAPAPEADGVRTRGRHGTLAREGHDDDVPF